MQPVTNNVVNLVIPGKKNDTLESVTATPHTEKHNGGNGGGDDMQSRVAKLEVDVEYVKRDISEIKTDIKSIDSRLSKIELSIASTKTIIKAAAAIVAVIFSFCTYIFGTYISKVLEAINGLVIK